jgi:hypothetical protein
MANRVFTHPPVMFRGPGFAMSGDHYEENTTTPPIPEYEDGVATQQSIERQMQYDADKVAKARSKAADSRWRELKTEAIIPGDGNNGDTIPESGGEQETPSAPASTEEKAACAEKEEESIVGEQGGAEFHARNPTNEGGTESHEEGHGNSGELQGVPEEVRTPDAEGGAGMEHDCRSSTEERHQ